MVESLSKLCACGCGEEVTGRRYRTNSKKEYRRGDLVDFISGHNMRGCHGGAENPQWRGEDVGYWALHKWVTRHFEKTGTCEHCAVEKRTEWASVGHVYTRDRGDWLELCRSCHWKMDGRIKNITGRLRLGREAF